MKRDFTLVMVSFILGVALMTALAIMAPAGLLPQAQAAEQVTVRVVVPVPQLPYSAYVAGPHEVVLVRLRNGHEIPAAEFLGMAADEWSNRHLQVLEPLTTRPKNQR